VKEPVWIDERDALIVHERLMALHGGAAGVRDGGLLSSALSPPLQQFAYAEGVNIYSLAALYTSAIVRNHPFVDGNKRTGFVVGILFLELNGYRFDASEEAAARAVLSMAAGIVNESEFASFLKGNSTKRW